MPGSRTSSTATSGRSAGIATDLGYVPRSLVDRLRGVHFFVCELNHDERMLADGPYPQSLKDRINDALRKAAGK